MTSMSGLPDVNGMRMVDGSCCTTCISAEMRSDATAAASNVGASSGEAHDEWLCRASAATGSRLSSSSSSGSEDNSEA